MSKSKTTGDLGEQEVIELVKCPNCRSKLMLLPPSFPMFDIQCTRCLFRAQIKTVSAKPRGTVFGAGWDIYEKVLKAGHLSPPLIVNFKWNNKSGSYQDIRFFPFISKDNVRKYSLSPTARLANYRMFLYVGLDKLPHIQLYISEQPAEI